MKYISKIEEVKHPAASRGASLRNPAKPVPKHQSEPRTPFLPVASHRTFWRRRVKVLEKNLSLTEDNPAPGKIVGGDFQSNFVAD